MSSTAVHPASAVNPLWRYGRPALVLLLAGLAVGVPLWLVVVTSAKPQAEAITPNLDLPRHWQPGGNYEEAVNQGEMLRGFLNSLLVVVPSVALVLILGRAPPGSSRAASRGWSRRRTRSASADCCCHPPSSPSSWSCGSWGSRAPGRG